MRIDELPATICYTRKSWFHLGHDGSVYFVNQRKGERSSGNVRLTRAEFRKFVDFYERAQKLLAPDVRKK